MSNGLNRKPRKPKTRAQLNTELMEEKAVRQQEYSEKVNALLKEGDCGLFTVVQMAENSAATIDKVLALPTQIIVMAN